MSFIENVVALIPKIKDNTDTLKSTLDNQFAAKRLPRFIGIISAFAFIFSYMQQFWGIINYVSIEPWPQFDAKFSSWLVDTIWQISICWLIYYTVVRYLLCWILCYIDQKKRTAHIVYFNTIDDLVDIGVSFFVFLYAIDELLYVVNNGFASYRIKYVYALSFVYLMFLFFGWVHRKNTSNPYATPTYFLDCKNQMIYEGDAVVYYKKVYRVRKENRIESERNEVNNKFVLEDLWDSQHGVLLEDAAKDEKGNLTVIRREKVSN